MNGRGVWLQSDGMAGRVGGNMTEGTVEIRLIRDAFSDTVTDGTL
jgi:hypothetical protein